MRVFSTGKIVMDVLANRNLRLQDYPCFSCPAPANKVCGQCIFASWNVKGIMAGFHPKADYRRLNKRDLTASPLILQVPRSPVMEVKRQIEQLHPRLGRLIVPSYNRMSELVNSLGM
jgi:hypothetical protein